MSESDREKTREEREEERDEEGELAKVWNLRPCKQKNKDQSGKGVGGTALPGRVAAKDVKKGKEEKFSISLTKMEIEQDFLAMTRSKPSSRPKKRSKTVQKQLDDTYPGMWLDSITPDSYKVNEAPDKVSISFDLLFILQHYVLYRAKKTPTSPHPDTVSKKPFLKSTDDQYSENV